MGDTSSHGRGRALNPATPEQIKELPRRYAIGKRPLSRLLGWGELTYTRLLDGGVPNEAHSEEIKRLLDDPAAFARLLEIGRKNGIITNVAYERSRRAVDALLEESGQADRDEALKIFAVADRICALTEGDVTPRTLQMLMRTAQERSRANGGEPLFEQTPEKVDWGYEYPQIAAGYSFVAIQGVANRMKGSVTPVGTFDDTAGATASAPAAEPVAASNPEPEPSKKKGKKAKKGKKGKDKKEKRDKKGKASEQRLDAKPVTDAEEKRAAESARKAFEQDGPLTFGECAIIDGVVERYRANLEASFT